jgi:hypothetical protein
VRFTVADDCEPHWHIIADREPIERILSAKQRAPVQHGAHRHRRPPTHLEPVAYSRKQQLIEIRQHSRLPAPRREPARRPERPVPLGAPPRQPRAPHTQEKQLSIKLRVRQEKAIILRARRHLALRPHHAGARQKEWTPAIVTKRQTELLALLEQHWRLKQRKNPIATTA